METAANQTPSGRAWQEVEMDPIDLQHQPHQQGNRPVSYIFNSIQIHQFPSAVCYRAEILRFKVLGNPRRLENHRSGYEELERMFVIILSIHGVATGSRTTFSIC
jgi:hypothetical protein